MSRIRSRNTKPELLVRRYLYANGFRYRVNVKTLPGTPDIVLRKYQTVVFIHGCFWHSHSCMAGRLPKSNTEFWRKKLERNQVRDRVVREQLRMMGWKTIIVWECQLKPQKRAHTLQELMYLLNRANLENLHKKYVIPEPDVRIAAEKPSSYGK